MNNINIQQIFNLLPHRYPFLLVDRVIDFDMGKSITALKNVTVNEEFFNGHFPEQPVMPGVLIVEALAQAAGVLAYKSTNWDPEESIFYLGSIDNTRFRRIVTPGDQLILKIEVLRRRNNIWKFTGTALVDSQVACYTEMTSAEGKRT